MSKYSIDSSTLTALGDAIRSKSGTSNEYYNIELIAPNPTGNATKSITLNHKSKIIINITEIVDLYTSDSYLNVYSNNVFIRGYQKKDRDNLIFEVIVDAGELKLQQYYGEYKFGLTIIPLDENGNEFKYTPLEMADKINDLTIMPSQAFNISGNCQYKFSYNGWEWFIKGYKDKIKCENITDASNMFNNSSNFTMVPTINLASPLLDNTFYSCYNVKEITVNWTNPKSTTNAFNATFYGCYSLRTINGLDGWPAICKGNSIFGLYNTFQSCYCLDELVNIPFIYSTYNGSYQFGSAFSQCNRLKRLVFKSPEAGESNVVPLKDATLDLTTTGFGSDRNKLTTLYNSGITIDKEVKDDETYQALKDDPDWFSIDLKYSRYNRISAIETINSLPDCSATGTNTIKFKGQAGMNTDGGAINTLTAEEIAVATAKGWTVSLT